MTGPLDIDRRVNGTTARFDLRGELDCATAPALLTAVAALAGARVAHVVVDLQDLAFIDGSGVHALARIDDEARAGHRDATFVRGPPAVQLVFDVLRLDGPLAFIDDQPRPRSVRDGAR